MKLICNRLFFCLRSAGWQLHPCCLNCIALNSESAPMQPSHTHLGISPSLASPHLFLADGIGAREKESGWVMGSEDAHPSQLFPKIAGTLRVRKPCTYYTAQRSLTTARKTFSGSGFCLSAGSCGSRRSWHVSATSVPDSETD